MQGVEIIFLEIVKNDERGITFQFPNRVSSNILLIKRKQGVISGKHYHTGKSVMKNPETIIIIDGEAEIILRNVKTKEEFKEIYTAPVMFKINPFIYHEIRSITDVTFLDMNGIDDDKGDTIKGFPED
ncbi:MAG: hypothetical protein WC916_07305 [Candidatus Woesearchaeota archaeon]